MTPCKTMAEFVKFNEKEVHKILAYLLRTSDYDIICDHAQIFYLAALRKGLLESFDWSLPDTKKSFSSYVYTALKHTLYSACRAEKRHKKGERISEVGCDISGMEDVFEVMYIGVDKLPTKKRAGVSLEMSHFTVSPAFESSCFIGDEEDTFFKRLQDFELEIKHDTTLSDNTRDLYLRFIQLSAQGVQTSTIAEISQVTSAYLTQVKGSLRTRFQRFKESVGYHPSEVSPL